MGDTITCFDECNGCCFLLEDASGNLFCDYKKRYKEDKNDINYLK